MICSKALEGTGLTTPRELQALEVIQALQATLEAATKPLTPLSIQTFKDA